MDAKKHEKTIDEIREERRLIHENLDDLISSVDVFGMTELMHAVRSGATTWVRCLLLRCTKKTLNHKDFSGKNALDHAIQGGNAEILALFQKTNKNMGTRS